MQSRAISVVPCFFLTPVTELSGEIHSEKSNINPNSPSFHNFPIVPKIRWWIFKVRLIQSNCVADFSIDIFIPKNPDPIE